MRAPKTNLDELKMSGSEFDRIMGQALQVHPGTIRRSKHPLRSKGRARTAQNRYGRYLVFRLSNRIMLIVL